MGLLRDCTRRKEVFHGLPCVLLRTASCGSYAYSYAGVEPEEEEPQATPAAESDPSSGRRKGLNVLDFKKHEYGLWDRQVLTSNRKEGSDGHRPCIFALKKVFLRVIVRYLAPASAGEEGPAERPDLEPEAPLSGKQVILNPIRAWHA